MHCKTCDYPLWNLRSRTCPECGAGFLPSEFEFLPNAVRFCCPGCGQDYYGTDSKGHLVPSEFACVRCGRHVHMDEMVLLPTEGVAPERTMADAVPWLELGRRGFLDRWLGTVWMAITAPGRLARAIPGSGGTVAAVLFGVLTGSVYLALMGPLLVLFPMVMGSPTGFEMVMLLFALVAPPVLMLAAVLGWAAVAHGILRLTGPTAGGFPRTLSCVSYAAATNVLVAIPCMGIYAVAVSWIWWVIASAVMMAVAQRVSGMRAALANAAPPMAFWAAVVGLVTLWAIPGIRGGIAAAGPAMSMAQAMSAANRAVSGLQMYQSAYGVPPPHGLALVAEDYLSGFELSLARPGVSGASAGMELARFRMLPPEQRAAELQRAVDALPNGVVAHRVGDVVFTYHGIDLSRNSVADRGLWLAVCAPPDPVSPGSPAAIFVGTLGGTVITIDPAQWQAKLAEQNALRAAAGPPPLPPLPDPLTVVTAAAAPETGADGAPDE